MSEKVMIYGAGGFGREVAWLVDCCLGSDHVCCFIDDDPQKHGQLLNEIPILSLKNAASDYPSAKVVAGIGNPGIRESLMSKAALNNLAFRTLIHPNVEVSKWVNIDEGAVICAGSILTTNITLGKHVQINLDCTVGHDVVMGDYSTLAPGVHVSGYVHIGKRAYIGTGAVIINGTQEKPVVIGDDVVVGAGACVTKSICCGTWGGGACQPFAQKRLKNGDHDRFAEWQYPEIEDGVPTKYNWVVQNKEGLRLGYKTDIGAFSYINAKHGIFIEDFVQIGSHCSIYSVSTIDNKKGKVILKKNCRIGSHSVIMPGVTVGQNAVVGTFSFVNIDIPDGETWVGVPAKKLR